MLIFAQLLLVKSLQWQMTHHWIRNQKREKKRKKNRETQYIMMLPKNCTASLKGHMFRRSFRSFIFSRWFDHFQSHLFIKAGWHLLLLDCSWQCWLLTVDSTALLLIVLVLLIVLARDWKVKINSYKLILIHV